MIRITINSIKVNNTLAEGFNGFKVGDTAYYVLRDNGKKLSPYFQKESFALKHAWSLVVNYGLTLVEPW